MLMERLRCAVAEPRPNWEVVSSWASQLSAIARKEAWLAQADDLRDFATRAFYECQLRLGTQPWCLPVLGAAGDETIATVRGLVYQRGATREYAEECLAALMVELFDQEKPRYGAIAFRALNEPDGEDLLVVVVMDGATGHKATFVGPRPAVEPEQPHLVAEPPGRHAERVESLQALFAGHRPSIHFGNKTYWKTWLAIAAAREKQVASRQD